MITLKLLKLALSFTLIVALGLRNSVGLLPNTTRGQVSSSKKIIEFFDLEKTMNDGTDTTIL